MADWSPLEGQRLATFGGQAASSLATPLTPGAANTKGSYAVITANTTFSADGFYLTVSPDLAGSQLVDIAIGPSGSETIIVPDLLVAQQGSHAGSIFIPIAIPANTRISGRCQSTLGATGIVRVEVTIVGAGFVSPSVNSRMTVYGTATADSGGTQIDPGASLNTEGSWTTLTFNTVQRHVALVVAFGGQADFSRADANFLVDIGIGPTGSETVVVGDLYARVWATTDQILPGFHGPFPAAIPPNTRLAVRAQSNQATAAERVFDVALYALS